MNIKSNYRSIAKEYSLITIGALFIAVGTYLFKFPNNFSTGGITGLAVILGYVIPFVTPGIINTALNLLLLLVGFIFLGREFGIKTVYSTILISLAINVLELIYPMTKPLTDQRFLELCFGVAIPSIGIAILFSMKASSGGTDIPAMILKKRFGIESGTALLICDMLIVVSSFFVFDMETALLSFFGLLTRSLVIDNAIESINRSKNFMIITTEIDDVKHFITHNLKRSATFWECEGAYTETRRYAIITVLNRGQAKQMREYVKSVDKLAFVIVMNTSDIVGKGFKTIN